eukprot:3115120-Rhodomonas_salina.1
MGRGPRRAHTPRWTAAARRRASARHYSAAHAARRIPSAREVRPTSRAPTIRGRAMAPRHSPTVAATP